MFIVLTVAILLAITTSLLVVLLVASRRTQIPSEPIVLPEDRTDETVAAVRAMEQETRNRLDMIEREMNNRLQSIGSELSRTSLYAERSAEHGEALRSTLGANHRRGKAGESTLQQLLSRTGVHFELQPTIQGQNGSLRPDAIVKLPDQMLLVVDSKFPSIKEGLSEEDAVKDFSEAFRRAVSDLSKKRYQDSIDGSLPFTVLLIPQIGGIADVELFKPGSVEWAADKRVLVTDPVGFPLLMMMVRELGAMWKLPDEWSEVSTLLGELHGDELELRVSLNKTREAVEVLVPAIRSAIEAVKDAERVIERLGELSGQSNPVKVKQLSTKTNVAKIPPPLSE